MPKPSNGIRQATKPISSNTPVGQRLARRANGVEDPKRMKLLAEILDESSSPKLNDVSSQQLGPRQVAENHARLLDLLVELRQLEGALNPVLPSRNEESWSKFFGWIDEKMDKNISGQVNVTKLICQDTNECEDEYSLVTKVPVKKGDKIFDINRDIFLTTDTVCRDPDLHDFIKKDSIASGMQNVVLVLHLLNEYSKQEQSYWWPYLSILPKKILPVLRLDKRSLTQYLLASSHIYEALKLLRSIARQYSYFYQRLHATRLPLRKDFTFEYYAWGVSCICSRQNEIPLGPTSRESRAPLPYHNVNALIPILDMCNHRASSNQAIFLDNSSCLLAEKDLMPGDEITINYGSQSRSTGEFYIHNGFVPELMECASDCDKTVSQRSVTYHDVVPLTIGLSKNNKLFEQKAKLLKILNMPTLGRFKLILNTHENRHKRDPHLSMFLIVYSLNEQELEYILDAPNPVGIADEIYEYVHYKKETVDGDGAMNGTEMSELDRIKRRLEKSVQEYLSLRASISIALIDRTIEEAKKCSTPDYHAIRLLQCERRIFDSYRVN